MTLTDTTTEIIQAELLRGCRYAHFEGHSDARGGLSVFEIEQKTGFAAKRVFLISVPDDYSEMIRAGHATSSAQIIAPLAGKYNLDLDNGSEKQTLVCEPSGPGIIVGAGVWRRLSRMRPGTLILVLAEESYSKTQYFSEPMPSLLPQE